MLLEDLPNAEICPQNLGGTERQLRNADLKMTYWIMVAGFCTSIVVFFTEVENCGNSPMQFEAKSLTECSKITVRFQILFRSLNAHMGFRTSFNNDMKPRNTENVTPPPSYATLFNRNRHKVWTTHTLSAKDSVSIPPDPSPLKPYAMGRQYAGFRNEFSVSTLMPTQYPPSTSAMLQYSYSK